MGDNLEVKNATPNVPTDEGNKKIAKKISILQFVYSMLIKWKNFKN